MPSWLLPALSGACVAVVVMVWALKRIAGAARSVVLSWFWSSL